MSTQILAAGGAAGTSTPVTVVAGTPVTVGLFVSGSPIIPSFDPPMKVQIQNPDASYTDTGVALDQSATTALLIAPGVYRVARGDIGESVGVHSS